MEKEKLKRIIYAFYLALGCILSYEAITNITNWLSDYLNNITKILQGVVIDYTFLNINIIILLGGFLLLISYYGFHNSKKFSRYLGMIGCVIAVSYSIYLILLMNIIQISEVIYLTNIFIILGLSIFLILVTLKYWKELN